MSKHLPESRFLIRRYITPMLPTIRIARVIIPTQIAENSVVVNMAVIIIIIASTGKTVNIFKIYFTCSRLSFATLSLFGTAEPFSIPASFLIKEDIGGCFVMKTKLLS